MRLEVRMVYWYRLKIPFADWVITRMFLAHWNLQEYSADNPLITPEKNAGWPDEEPGALTTEEFPGGDLGESMKGWADAGHYLFPIRVNFGMRMMTPAKKKFFDKQGCSL
jgi:hypothetical protein